jgi:acetyl-CoA decarbonylase/synthase complex subunit delta
MAYKHTVISSTPIDVNLAKQLNILLENLGVPKERIIVDPTTGGLGYGLEYSYSVMERIRMAALAQEDDKLQYALINNVGNEVWKSKEAKLTTEEAPTLGEAAKRGVLMEAVAAVTYLLAGSDLLILRHPETAKLVRKFIDLLITGDTVLAPADLAAKYKALNVKPEGNYPEIGKTAAAVKEEKKAAAPPKEKAVAPKDAPSPKPAVAPKPAAAAKPEAPAAAQKEAPPVDAAAEAKAKAEAEAKAKAEAETQAKAAAAAKAQAAADAQAKAQSEVKAKEEAERKAREEAKAQSQAAEEALAAARAAERAKRDAGKEAPGAEGPKVMKVAETQLSPVEKLLAQINRANKRN